VAEEGELTFNTKPQTRKGDGARPVPRLRDDQRDAPRLRLGKSSREIGSSLPNNQRQHRTSHTPKDVLP